MTDEALTAEQLVLRESIAMTLHQMRHLGSGPRAAVCEPEWAELSMTARKPWIRRATVILALIASAQGKDGGERVVAQHYFVDPRAASEMTPEQYAEACRQFDEAAKHSTPMDIGAIDAHLRPSLPATGKEAVDYDAPMHDPTAGKLISAHRLTTGSEVRTPGTVEVCERHATGHDCSGEMDIETGRIDKPCRFYLCPLMKKDA